MSQRARTPRSIFLDAPHASGRGFDGEPAPRARGWRRLMPAAAFVAATLVVLTSLTLPVTSAQAYEVPTTGPVVGSVVNSAGTKQVVQTQGSGLKITYDVIDGAIASKFETRPVLTADATNVGGSPALSANSSLVQLRLNGPTTTAPAPGCVSTTSPTRYTCASYAQLKISFSQPVTDPKIYIGRLGGAVGSIGLWTDGRLVAFDATGSVALSTLDNTNGNSNLSLVSNGWKVGDAVTGASGIGTDCGANPSAGCGSFTATGTITSLTFALDYVATAPTTSGADGFSISVATPQQFSTGPVSYNGTGGTSAPFHVPGDLKLGAAINGAGISTTQNTTSSPVVKTSPATVNTGVGAGDSLATLPDLLATTASQTITFPVSGASKDATLAGWVDWNKNGVFDATERTTSAVTAGATSAALSVTAPATAIAGQLYARFRLSYTAADVTNPTGAASSGEVEDYAIVLKPTIAVTNSASSSAGTFDLKVTNSASAVTTVKAAAEAGDSSGAKSVFNNSTYGVPVITVAQDPLVSAVPLTVTQTQVSVGTYKVGYVCVNGAGTQTTGTLPNSIQGSTSTISGVSIPASNTAGTTILQQAISCTFTNTLISVDAIDDSITVAQNTATSPATNVLGNDTASNTTIAPTKVTIVTAPTHGTVAVDATTGAITYTPSSNYSGADSYVYKVCDVSATNGVCDTATVSITVGANTVTANPDSASTTPGVAVTTDILANDTVATGGAPLNKTTVAVTTAAAHGSTSVSATTGAVTYTPAAGFSGTDTYTYTVCDTSAPTPVCKTALVTVQVPNAFTAGPGLGSLTTPQNTPLTTTLGNLVSTTGAAVDPTKVTQSVAPAHGTLSIDPNTGDVTYQPTSGFTGTDSYQVKVCDLSLPSSVCTTITVTVQVGANSVVSMPDAASTSLGTAVVLDVLSNDSVATGGAPLNKTSVTIASSAAHGTTTVDPATGAVTYTPTGTFTGQDSFTYKVCDTSTPTPVCGTAVGTVVVNNAFTPGSATSGISTPQNSPITTPVTALATTTGAALDPTKVTQVTAPSHGSLSISAAGDVTYTPTAGYAGPDSYDVKVCDLSVPSQCTTVTIPVTVTANVVTAVPDAASTTVGTPVTVAVITNDSVPSGRAPIDPASVLITAAPGHGSTTVDSSGVVTYSPAAGFTGVDTFTYKVCDTSNPTVVCGSAVVTVTVNNVFSPGADAAGITTGQNSPVTTPFASIATSTGAALDPTKVTQVTAPSHGSLSISATTGDVVYTPTAGYTGTDSYDVKVCDLSVPSQCTTVTIPVTVGANVVTAVADAASTTVGVAVTVPVLGNDTVKTGGAPLDKASVLVTGGPAHGSTSVDTTTGAIEYTPAAKFSGVDTFTYKVCDTSNPTALCDTAVVTVTVNNVFSPGADAAGITTGQNSPVTTPFASIATSTGAALDPTKVTQVTAPSHGSLSINATTGDVVYTPTAGYTGTDSYDVKVCDLSVPSQCTTVTIPVTVGANVVTAVADAASTTVGTPVTVPVVGNDTVKTGGAALNNGSLEVTVDAAHGATSVNTTTGEITYSPAAKFSGVDTFTYKVCDTSTPTAVCDTAIATVTVANGFVVGTGAVSTPQNTAVVTPLSAIVTTTGAATDPTAVTPVTNPTHGSIMIDPATGDVTYTPTAGYSGSDSYAVNVCDLSVPTQCSTVTVPVTVGANAVDAKADAATTPAVTSIVIPVLANDTTNTGGAPLDPATVTVPIAAVHGTTTINPATGAVTYTPAAGFSGTDSFMYRVCDTSNPSPVCDTATVTVTVTNVFTNGPATSGISTLQNTDITTPLSSLVSVTGSPLDPASVTELMPPAHGSIVTDPITGAVTYSPDPGYSGPDTYSVTICDTAAVPACTTVTVTVVVGANAVLASPDAATTTAGVAVTTNVIANDSVLGAGASLDATSVSVTVVPGHGTTSVNAVTGEITYTPATGFSGTDSYTYQVCDLSVPTRVCGSAVVTVTVTNVFIPGPATGSGAGTIVTAQNSPITVPLSDIVSTTGLPIDPATLAVKPGSGPTNGSVSIDPVTGRITFTPTPGFSGPDTFVVTFCDTGVPASCGEQTVTVTVAANVVTPKPDSVKVGMGDKVVISPLANDLSASGQALDPTSVRVSIQPRHGTVTVNPLTGELTYAPSAGWMGADEFSYTVCDTSFPTPACGTTTVSITTLPAVLAYTGGTVLVGLQLGLFALLGGVVLMLVKRRRDGSATRKSVQGEQV